MISSMKLGLLWLLLITLTVISALVAEPLPLTLGLVAVVLLVTVVKASVLVEYFMGLNAAPWLWRGLLLAYVPVLAGLITLTYLF